MKAFIASFIAVIVISVVAGFVAQGFQKTAQEANSTENVRLSSTK